MTCSGPVGTECYGLIKGRFSPEADVTRFMNFDHEADIFMVTISPISLLFLSEIPFLSWLVFRERRNMRLIFGTVFLVAAFFTPTANSMETIGVVLMHGKGGTLSLVASLADSLRAKGVVVTTPLMPWSRDRIYDKSYQEAMEEITTYIADLKSNGATKIFLAGHSLGANAALGYSARQNGLSGVILLAYGHVPGKKGMQRKVAGTVEKAREMIEAGKGEEVSDFVDTGGSSDEVRGTANDILSWFDPEGPANTEKNAQNVKDNIPVLCIDGESDNWKRCSWILNLVPSAKGNRKAIVDADHRGTPAASVEVVFNWLSEVK